MPRRQWRDNQVRDRHRKIIARDQPPCAICGCEIDYDAPQYHPRSFTIDHITPLILGGTDTLDNLQPACWSCNMRKGRTMPAGTPPPRALPFNYLDATNPMAAGIPADQLPPGVSFITGRTW